MNKMEYKGALTEIKDISEKGVVTFYASVFGNKDHGGDIIERGAFAKTIMENSKNIRHFKHHDMWKMVGVLQELKEDNAGLIATSKLILKTQLGLETYEEYKAMVEAGKSMDHSIGYKTIKFEEENRDNENYTRKIKEVKLFEVSTLTAWGMNPLAQTVSVKSFDQLNFNDLLTEERFYKNLLNSRFTDAKLEQLEGLHNHIKSLIIERAAQGTQEDNKPIRGEDAVKQITFNL